MIDFKGPERRKYYDMDPWYKKILDEGNDDWNQQVEESNKVFRNEVNCLLKDINTKSIIETGCGAGNFSLSLDLTDEQNYDAFDFSPVAIDMARGKNNPNNINFFSGDILEIETYKKDNYDLIISKDVLHCVIGEDRIKYLKNVSKRMNENSKFILSTHGDLPVKHPGLMKFIDENSRINHLHTRVYLDKKEIESEIVKTGFRILKTISPVDYMFIFILDKIS